MKFGRRASKVSNHSSQLTWRRLSLSPPKSNAQNAEKRAVLRAVDRCGDRLARLGPRLDHVVRRGREAAAGPLGIVFR
jgi:hypothetical protein